MGVRLCCVCLSVGLCLSLSLLLAGCDDGRPVLVEATGRVLLRGAGVTAGSIVFHPDAGNAFQVDAPSSQLQLDGSFLMQTYPWGEGVAVGRYRVILSPQLAARLGLAEYSDPTKSPLQVDVTADGLRGHVIELPAAAGVQQGKGGKR